jgi:hypothetical protein
MMVDPGRREPDLLLRVEQVRAQCRSLRARVAELAEAERLRTVGRAPAAT